MNLALVFESGDFVLIGVFLTLVLMSAVTWTVIVVRTLKLRQAKKANAQVKDKIWAAKSLEEATQIAQNAQSPMSMMLLEALKANIARQEADIAGIQRELSRHKGN